MKPGAQTLKKALFWTILIIVALLPLALGEWYFYRKFMKEFGSLGYTKEHLAKGRLQDSPYSVYEPVPNTLNLKSKFRQNNYGFRDEEDTGPKQEGEYRIFILGGSGAIGQGAMQQFIRISGQHEYASEYTISAYLERMLREAVPERPIQVINAAVSGFKLNHEYPFYMSTIRKLEPDLLILIDGYNDLFFPLEGDFYVSDYDRGLWENHRYKTDFTYKYGMYLMSKSYIFFYLGKELFTSKYDYDEEVYTKWLNTPPPVDTAALEGRWKEKLSEFRTAMDDVFKRYEIFLKTCEVDSVDILFCPQPLLSLKPFRTDVEKALYSYNASECGVDELMAEHQGYRYFLARFDSLAAARDLNYLNLQWEINKSQEQIFVDYCHLTFLGNETIADLIKDKILEMNLIKAAPAMAEK
jgi:hypothetical protein